MSWSSGSARSSAIRLGCNLVTAKIFCRSPVLRSGAVFNTQSHVNLERASNWTSYARTVKKASDLTLLCVQCVSTWPNQETDSVHNQPVPSAGSGNVINLSSGSERSTRNLFPYFAVLVLVRYSVLVLICSSTIRPLLDLIGATLPRAFQPLPWGSSHMTPFLPVKVKVWPIWVWGSVWPVTVHTDWFNL